MAKEEKFWLSAKSVPLTLNDIAALDDDKSRQMLAQMRWGAADEQVCPDWGLY